MKDQHEIIERIIDATEVALIYCSHHGEIEILNKPALDIFKATREDLVGKSIEILIQVDKKSLHESHREEFAKNPGPRALDERQGVFAKRFDGELFPAEVALNPIETSQERGILCTVIDISNRAEREKRINEYSIQLEEKNKELEKLSITDPLTNIPNRRHFSQKAIEAIGVCASDKSAISLAFLDIDNFKEFNDAFGHGKGDEVLVNTANILQGIARSTDIIARFGGDEFAILFPKTGKEEIESIAKRLSAAFLGEVHEQNLGISIGLSTVLPKKGGRKKQRKILGDLLKKADIALYHVKNIASSHSFHIDDI